MSICQQRWGRKEPFCKGLKVSIAALGSIYLASGNSSKLDELQAQLPELNLQLAPDYQAPEENGASFVENALIKARTLARQQGAAALADDSGLLVEALDGAPGLYSSRYAGTNASDAQNRQLLLQRLQTITARAAYFHCTLVLLRGPEDPCPLIASGNWHGQIARQARGDNGFGYDSIFYLPDLACSAAQLESERKNKLSHRAQAVQALRAQLAL